MQPHSRPVRSEAHFICCVAYIDLNAVGAGLADVPTGYEFGSARHHVSTRCPPWIDRRRVTAYVPGTDPVTGRAALDAYLRTLGGMDPDFVRRYMERKRAPGECDAEDPLGILISAPRPGRIAWLP